MYLLDLKLIRPGLVPLPMMQIIMIAKVSRTRNIASIVKTTGTEKLYHLS